MEKYILEVRKSRDWFIEFKKYIDKDIKIDKAVDIEIDLPFGQSEFYKGDIRWLMDHRIDDEMIDMVKDLKVFQKKAIFEPHIADEKVQKWETKEEFQGTFIDALKYIKEVFYGRDR